MDDRSPNMLRPTLIAGALFGALSAVPFLSLLNCACCALLWGCGLLAARLYSGACRGQGVAFRPATGAVVGLIAGAFYALAQTVTDAVFKAALGDPTARWLVGVVEALPNVPDDRREMMLAALREAAEPKVTAASLLMGFFLTVLLAAVFSTLGGLIGGAVFKVQAEPGADPAGRAGGPGGPPVV